TEPARWAGLEMEPGLVDALMADVRMQPGSLPLLSTCLLDVWERRTGNVMTLQSYRDSGGVRGAVARLAETAYCSLTENDKAVARTLLLRLCTIGPGNVDVRNAMPINELAATHPDAPRVPEQLMARRLLVTDGDLVQLTHDALLVEWPRLRQWLDEGREDRRLHKRVTDAALEWEQSGRNPDLL